MRIVCDNCGAKYQISDDKVRNKVFKIRCKRCSHVIVVRADQSAKEAAKEPEGAAAAAEQQPAAASPDAIWYVVINREQKGPLTPEGVEQYFRGGQIDADTFTWAEGMADWMRLVAIPQFAHLAPAPAAPEPAAAQQRSPEPEQREAAQPDPGAFRGLDDESDVMASNNAEVTVATSAPVSRSGASPSLFGDDGGHEAASPRVDEHSLRNQRNENSVLFSLDSLAAEADHAPRVTNTGGREGSGLIDISALGGMGATPASGASGGGFGGDGGFAPVAAAPVGPGAGIVRKSGGGAGKYALIAFAVVALIGGAVAITWMLTQKDKVAAPVATKPNAPVVAANVGDKPGTVGEKPAEEPGEKPAAVPAEKPAEEPTEEPAEDPAEKPAEEPGAKKPAPAAKPKRTARNTRRARNDDAEDQPPPRAAAPTAKPAAKPAAKPRASRKAKSEVDDLLGALDGNSGGGNSRSAPPAGGTPAKKKDPLLPPSLNRKQILTVVRRGAGGISSCKSRAPGGGGTIKVAMTIAGTGRVSSARAGSPYSGTPLGACVESKVKSFRFPQFSGSPMSLTMPFAL